MTKVQTRKIGHPGNRVMFFCPDKRRAIKGFGPSYIHNGAEGTLKGFSSHLVRVHFDGAPAERVDPVDPDYVVPLGAEAGPSKEVGREVLAALI